MFCFVCVLGRMLRWEQGQCNQCDRCGFRTDPDEGIYRGWWSGVS